MSSRNLFRKSFQPWVYTGILTGAVGGASVYIFSFHRKHHSFPAPPPLRLNQDGTPILPKFPSIKTRAEHISDLKKTRGQAEVLTSTSKPASSNSTEVYDLLVIGGGATGTGIALDAVTRGLKVALVERDDFSSGTSSKSTKLVHGGVRYLEKAVWNLDYGQYQLVREALRERQTFLEIAPHLSSWLSILLPLRKWWEAPYFWVGAKAYDLLASSEGLQSSYFMTGRKTIEAYPTLSRENLVGSLVYFDGQHNDSRMNIALAMTAAHYGATIVNHAEVVGLEKDASGRLCGARIRDLVPTRNGTGTEDDGFLVYAKGIINATGPYVDAIQQMDKPTMRDIVAPSTGIHVVLPGYLSPPNMGLIDPATDDGRVVFFLPWQGNTIAGTTDTPCGIENNPIAGEEDIDWVLKDIRAQLAPEINLKRSDVLAAWSGL
jgi:glycerol-3-phosphate dehydrogenase